MWAAVCWIHLSFASHGFKTTVAFTLPSERCLRYTNVICLSYSRFRFNRQDNVDAEVEHVLCEPLSTAAAASVNIRRTVGSSSSTCLQVTGCSAWSSTQMYGPVCGEMSLRGLLLELLLMPKLRGGWTCSRRKRLVLLEVMTLPHISEMMLVRVCEEGFDQDVVTFPLCVYVCVWPLVAGFVWGARAEQSCRLPGGHKGSPEEHRATGGESLFMYPGGPDSRVLWPAFWWLV